MKDEQEFARGAGRTTSRHREAQRAECAAGAGGRARVGGLAQPAKVTQPRVERPVFERN